MKQGTALQPNFSRHAFAPVVHLVSGAVRRPYQGSDVRPAIGQNQRNSAGASAYSEPAGDGHTVPGSDGADDKNQVSPAPASDGVLRQSADRHSAEADYLI